MKQNYFLVALFFLSSVIYAQSDQLIVVADGVQHTLAASGTTHAIPVANADIKDFTISKYALTESQQLEITGPDGEQEDYRDGTIDQKIEFDEDLVGNEVVIQLMDDGNAVSGKKWSFRLKKAEGQTTTGGTAGNTTGGSTTVTGTVSIDGATITHASNLDYDQYISDNYLIDDKYMTPFGIIDNEKRVHIFIDNMGNNLQTTIPQGIANAQYVVHVLYPYAPEVPNNIVYSIKQRSGSFNSNLNFRNSDAKIKLQSGVNYEIREKRFVLSTSTDDISFDLIGAQANNNTVTKTVIDNYTIKMSPTYHGSFDVGLVRSELTNPTYSLITSADGQFQTVKVADNGESEGVVTLMATFYYSPVVILRDLLDGKDDNVPFYKKNGRNFLDDHEIYERFYPTVGVGVKDKVFENLFYGINWEVVRGIGLFYGWNYGKVNTFNMPGFEEGITPVSTDQFNYYTREKWKTAQAFGVKLDLLVFMGLFGQK